MGRAEHLGEAIIGVYSMISAPTGLAVQWTRWTTAVHRSTANAQLLPYLTEQP